jgi:hypothetical protein
MAGNEVLAPVAQTRWMAYYPAGPPLPNPRVYGRQLEVSAQSHARRYASRNHGSLTAR